MNNILPTFIISVDYWRDIMSTLAIIAEYNPYHNGHAYLLAEAKRITGADNSIAVMSGNFVQRGEPALLNKYERAKLAVKEGIDLVVELPFCYSTGSAYDFASGAVAMVDSLGVVDYLCFGVECQDENILNSIADVLESETDNFKSVLKQRLSNGLSYPAARSNAIISVLRNSYYEEVLKEILSSPNNILAIEYLCAIRRMHSSIQPIMIKRISSNYHDNELKEKISSATAIRNALATNSAEIEQSVSKDCYELLLYKNNVESPVLFDDLTPYLQELRLKNSLEYFYEICDFNEDLANRMSGISKTHSITELTSKLSSKNWTDTRIKRALLHSLLGYTTKDHDSFTEHWVYYGNILCFCKEKSNLLRQIKDKHKLCLITKKADFESTINNWYQDIDNNAEFITTAKCMWKLDQMATELYNCLVYNRYHIELPNDYAIKPPIINK